MATRCGTIGRWVWVVAVLWAWCGVRADVAVYTQAPSAGGGQYKSAWYAPDGLDSDERVWDAFTLSSATAITRVQWRGAYTNDLSGAGRAPVYDFDVAIYGSIAGGSQPDVVTGPLRRYRVGSNAGETPAGTAGGVAMYDYAFTLPSAFQAAAGVKYWLQVVAWQGLTPTYSWPPDWSLARGTGGDGSHFRRLGGTGGMFQSISGDCAFTLLAATGPTYVVSATPSPAGAGTIVGAGVYAAGSSATLVATPAAGWGFSSWTQNGSTQSQNASYTFVVNANRTLVANFVPAYTVTVQPSPTYGGAATGGGVFNEGRNVTVSATPAPGYVFAGWSEWGTPVSSANPYTFVSDADHTLTADFVLVPGGAMFTFDDAPVHTSLPVVLSADGLGAVFSATGQGFSIQPAGTLGFTPAGFSGLCVYPNSVFAADLVADFDQPLVSLSVLYSSQELGCDDSARMRVTAFRDGVAVGTATTTAPVPGTWPTGTLSISVPGGFTHAVIHYDARPPTCQDYGVIFLADNMTVVRACAPAGITDQPLPTGACEGTDAVMTVLTSGTQPITYQWRRGGTAIDTLTNPSAGTDTLIVPGVTPADQGSYDCIVTNACGSVTSNPADLTVLLASDPACGGPACDPDFNQDGNADQDDVAYLINVVGGGANPTGRDADFNHDGNVDQDDVAALISVVAGGPCP